MQNSILYRLIYSDTYGKYVVGALLAMVIVIPILNVTMPEGSLLHVSTYTVTVLGKFLCYALLALALDLVWGYCGILSLGHGAFFALGGYAMGMYLMRQIGDRGVYGNPDLPDFMVFLNWESLPWYWYGFDGFGFAAFMVLFVPGLLAFVFGWLAFRSRVTGVYLSIITQALTFVLMKAFYLNDFGFGGNNGFTDFKDILGFDAQANSTRLSLFILSGLALILSYLLCRFIITSKMGKVLVSIRDAESRSRFLGYRVEHYKLAVFVLSAALAGLAGALFVPQAGIINPDQFSPIFSIEVVIWVALGGRGMLFGAVIGALVVNYAKTFYTGALPEIWLFVLGAIFVISTIYANRGVIIGVVSSAVIVGLIEPLFKAWMPDLYQFILMAIAVGIIYVFAHYFEVGFAYCRSLYFARRGSTQSGPKKDQGEAKS